MQVGKIRMRADKKKAGKKQQHEARDFIAM